jgi:hypothetical protein
MLFHHQEGLNLGEGRVVYAAKAVSGAMSHPDGANSSSMSEWAKVP